MVPSATTLPRAMTPSREQISSAWESMWVEKRTHLPARANDWTASSTVRVTMGSRPVVGSSRISTGGSWTTARASETRCFMPVESRSFARSA